MSEQNNPKAPELTQAQVEENQHVQHLHRVFGADNSERSSSQKHVYEWLERVVNMPVFTVGKMGQRCNITAAINDGQRLLANQIITDIKKSAVSAVTKPTVTKYR